MYIFFGLTLKTCRFMQQVLILRGFKPRQNLNVTNGGIKVSNKNSKLWQTDDFGRSWIIFCRKFEGRFQVLKCFTPTWGSYSIMTHII